MEGWQERDGEGERWVGEKLQDIIFVQRLIIQMHRCLLKGGAGGERPPTHMALSWVKSPGRIRVVGFERGWTCSQG